MVFLFFSFPLAVAEETCVCHCESVESACYVQVIASFHEQKARFGLNLKYCHQLYFVFNGVCSQVKWNYWSGPPTIG